MALDLLDRCSETVPIEFQEEGYAIADRGDVELFRAGSAGRFLALVFVPERKKEPLLVVVRWIQQRRGALNVSCSCGQIQSWQSCPHVWAVLVGMSRQGYSADIPGGAPLHLACSAVGKDEKRDLMAKLLGLSRDPRAPKLLAAAANPPARAFAGEIGETRLMPLFDGEGGLTMVPVPVAGPGPVPGPTRRGGETEARRAFGDPGREPAAPGETSGLRPAATLDPPRPRPAAPPDWRHQLGFVIPPKSQRDPKKPRRLFYFLGAYDSLLKTFGLEFWQQEQLAAGGWGVLKPAAIQANELADLEPDERRLVRRLLEAHRELWMEPPREIHRARAVAVPASLLPFLLPALARTGRFGRMIRPETKEHQLWQWDGGGPWRLAIAGRSDEGGRLALRGRLRRGEEDLPLDRHAEILQGGLFRRGNLLAELDEGAADEWLRSLQHAPEIVVPEEEVPEALTRLAQAAASPPVELDASWQGKIAAERPIPALRLGLEAGEMLLPARLRFLYGELEVAADDPRELLFDEPRKLLVRRDRQRERECALRLPFALAADGAGLLAAEDFAGLVEELAGEGWLIGTEGRKVRTGGRFKARVESGVDWFDLGGSLAFGEERIALPALLQAVREGRGWVNLADGSVGLLPPGWVRRWSALVELSRSRRDFRFGYGQALLLDNLLREEGEVETDAVFARIRAKLRSFDRLEPAAEPPGFRGQLRPYQRLGLAWLELLAELGLSGCLADDMGLGKTVQVLAWLLRRRQQGQNGGRPTLLVVPRSLVHNWAAELRRFTPELRFAVAHGAGRDSLFEDLGGNDVFITTYGTLARDVEKLRGAEFDTVILDEAQAIKNRSTLAAEACSAVPARLRLALTGTPVENHLGELWSIFDFLNPGLLGSLPRISKYAGRLRLPPTALAEVATALRPLILRRKKSEVLRDLPEKTEQTLFCELSAEERADYDELRRYYQLSLHQKIAEVGLDKAKIWVLEALLRLRQAACHPGLIDKKAAGRTSAKLETLLENLEQVLQEGHKAIVFSQFTSLLAILRQRLDAAGLRYEYLDGQTRDRQERVERFQTDPEQRLFLISLKAGGVGLNLTAASYVFLLDPWWNPAVEAQAIDRAHRIGQENPVFAYRIIASGTVEEKILELQEDKRSLADAIVAGDNRVLKQLTAADLEQLLG